MYIYMSIFNVIMQLCIFILLLYFILFYILFILYLYSLDFIFLMICFHDYDILKETPVRCLVS